MKRNWFMSKGFFHTVEALLLLVLLISVFAYWPHPVASPLEYESILLATCEDALLSMNAAQDFSFETLSFLSLHVWPHHRVELELNGQSYWSNDFPKGTPTISCSSTLFYQNEFVPAQLFISGFQI